MTTDALLLVARASSGSDHVLATHAERLRAEAPVDAVHAASYEHEPGRELRDRVADIDADRVFAVPLFAAHDHDTLDALPAALSRAPAAVEWTAPIGESPAVTDVLRERAIDARPPGGDTALVLVAAGSSSGPHHRQTAEYHAARLAAETEYADVTTAFLVQNPAVECARYRVSADRIVSVPLFVAPSAATTDRVPAALELDRGGVAYADPLGTHPRLTDAILGELAKRRSLAGSSHGAPGDAPAAGTPHAIATDGEGPPRSERR